MINSKTTKYDLIAQLHLKFYLNTVQILNCHDNKKKQINVITKYKWCETGSGCCKMQKTNLFTDQSDKFTKSAVCCGLSQSTCLPPELQWHKELLAELTINSASFEST